MFTRAFVGLATVVASILSYATASTACSTIGSSDIWLCGSSATPPTPNSCFLRLPASTPAGSFDLSAPVPGGYVVLGVPTPAATAYGFPQAGSTAPLGLVWYEPLANIASLPNFSSLNLGFFTSCETLRMVALHRHPT